MSFHKWRTVEQRVERERLNEDRCNALKGMLKEQCRQAVYGECDTRVEAMRRQRCEALERHERLAVSNFVKSEQEKENRKQLTDFQERLADELSKKKANEAREEVVRRRVVDGSQELRVLKEKLHAAQVNKVWARQLLEKQEREEMALQEEAKLAAHLEDLRIKSEEADVRENKLKALRMKALMKDNQELLASKLRDGDALQQYEDDKRMVEEVMVKLQDEDRRELQARVERKKSNMETLLKHQEESEQIRRREERRQVEEEEKIEEFAKQKREWEEQLAKEKRAQEAERWRVQQEMVRQQNERNREAQQLERLREDLLWEEKDAADRRRELLQARKKLEDKQEMLNAYQEHVERQEKIRAEEIAKEQEERQALMARYEEENHLDQLSAQKRRMKMQEYRRAVDQQIEERRERYAAARLKELEDLERMRAEEAEQVKIVEEERQALLRKFAPDARHFPKGALVKESDFDAVGLERPRAPEKRPVFRNNLGIPPYPARFQPPAR